MKELAKSLKLQRLSQGLTLAEISARSRIGIGALQQIEAGNLSGVGSEFLITSYLRAYGEALEARRRDLGEYVQPELKGSEPNDLSRKLQQARSRVVRWRAFAMILMTAVTGLILSEALWVFDRHPLREGKKAPEQHSEALPHNLKLSKADEKVNASGKTDDLNISQAPEELPTHILPQLQQVEIEERRIDSGRQGLREERRQPIAATEIEGELPAESAIDPNVSEKLSEPSEDTEQLSETPAVGRLQRGESEIHVQGFQELIFPSVAGLLSQLEFIDRTSRAEEYFNPGHASPIAIVNDDTAQENHEPIRDEPDTHEPDANVLRNDNIESHLTAARESVERKHLLEIQTIDECWVQIKIDGKKLVSDLLKAGEHRTWEVKKGVELVLGNAGGAKIKWDGHPLALVGKPGRVVRLRLPDPTLIEQKQVNP